jgi:hypothetical protein
VTKNKNIRGLQLSKAGRGDGNYVKMHQKHSEGSSVSSIDENKLSFTDDYHGERYSKVTLFNALNDDTIMCSPGRSKIPTMKEVMQQKKRKALEQSMQMQAKPVPNSTKNSREKDWT